MSKRVKGIFADIVLVSVALIWIVGVDHVPCLKMVGFPLLLLSQRVVELVAESRKIIRLDR